MNYIKRLLTAPIFEDEVKTQQAYMLHVILWTLICVPIPFVIYSLFRTPQDIVRTMIQAGFGETVSIILLIMLRRGFVKAASIIQVTAFWLFFTATAMTGSGVHGEAYLLGYGLVIAIAGILLGGIGALIFTCLSLAAGGLMVFWEMENIIKPVLESSPLTTWIVSLVLFPVGAVLQYLAARATRNSFERTHATEEKYRLISRVSSDYTFSTIVNSDGTMHLNWVAGAFKEITGFTYEEYIDSGNWSAHLHPDDIEQDAKDMANLQKGQSVISEVRTYRKDGSLNWVQVSAQPVWDEKQNRMSGIVGAVKDITERKLSEEALRYERDLLQIFMDNIPDTVYFKDAASRFVRINRAQAQFLKLKDPQAAIGKTDLDFQSSDLAQQFIDEEQQIITTGQAIINRIEFNPTEDGKPRWLSATKVPVEDSAGIVLGTIGISRDITEQKESQENLQKIFLQQAAILNNIPDMAWLKDKDSRYIAVNEQFAKRAGMKTEDMIGKSDHEVWKNNYAESYRQDDLVVMQSRLRKNAEELEVDSQGNEYWIETSKTPIMNTAGEVIGTTGIAREITERKKAEKAEQYRRSTLEKILKLGQYVTEVQDLSTTLQRIWQSIRHDLNFDRLGIYLYDPEHNTMHGTYGTNSQGEIIEEWDSHISLDDETVETISFISVLHNTNNLHITHDYETEHNIPSGHIMSGVKEYAAVAARSGDKPVAVLCVDQAISKRSISTEQMEALRLFAGYAGLAIENARLNDALQKELQLQKHAENQEMQRREMLEKVVRLGKQVTEVSNLKTTLEKVWHGVHDELGFDRLAIFLYDQESYSIKGTLGTNNQGEIVEEWEYARPLDTEKPTSFTRALEQPDGVFFTTNFAVEFNIPDGHEMRDVKDFAAVTAWGGNKPVAIITVDNDLSKRPFTKEQLEALRLFSGYAGLAIENARLNTALEEDLTRRKTLIDELETKNAELERFTYTVSHDLKSPLVTITGFLGYLEQDALAGNAERIKSNINRISGAARKMQALLNDLLELSRIGRIMNTPEAVSFEEIVHEAVDRVHGRLNEINAIIEIQRDLPVINGDRIRLVEVIQNLIDNAAKYSNPATRSRIEIGTTTNAENVIVFYVRDNGIGIAPKYHDNIFGLFNKLNATSEGTGIGLTLVKRIVEVHGGRIWLESDAGKGATFYFTLPIR